MTDPRTPIFEAVRKAGGSFPNQAAVTGFHAKLDTLGVPREIDLPPPAPAKTGPSKTLVGTVGVSAAALLTATLALWEGKRNVGYFDIVGVATACYGDTNDVKVGQRYSDAECSARLESQALAHIEPVLACTPSLKGHDNQLVAAGSLAYNIGPSAYCRSTVDARFDAGDWKGACDAFLAWNRAGGREVAGLTNRRRYERDLCLKGL